MATTETKHLTSLAFDLTQMQAQLQSIPATVEESAKAAQDAWNNNFSAGGSGSKDGAKKSSKKSAIVSTVEADVNTAKGKLGELDEKFKESGKNAQGFLQKLSDKARWLAAFYLIQGVINGFKNLISTVKETETAVVGLQRVLNEDVSSSNVSGALYDIAYEYGRTFEEVQESATLFAQTGKSWDDVLTLTRGTMLALNTAELDVTQATQGLIAVMAQWNLEADDYVGLIDKINKTADDYAITSEAIVAAMQRAGSTAKTYGMSLEELIGTITALGEATGRSGDYLGTAISSLITYTTKTKSLNVMREMGIDPEDAEGNMRPVLELWSELAQKIKGGNVAFAEFMATDEEATDRFLADSEEYQKLVETERANGKEIQSIYSTAGAYRKNAFIVVLDNLDTAAEAVRNMTDAEGYSVTENEKYMATLTAISNQLSASWKQLAVEFGDAGFLEFLKFISDAAIGMAKLIGNTGGLKVSLFALLGILTMIKAQQISEMITGWGQAFKTAVTGANAAKVAVTGLQAAFGWIGLVVTALSLLIGAINGVNAAAEANRQKLLDAGDAARKETESLNSLINKYEELANSAGFKSGDETALASAKKIHEDIVAILGDQAEGWDLVNGKVDENIAKLREAQVENAKKNLQDLQAAADAANKDLNTPKPFTLSEVWNLPKGIAGGEDTTSAIDKLAKEQGAQAAIDKLEEWAAEFGAMGEDGVDALAAVNAKIAEYQAKVDAAKKAEEDLAAGQAFLDANAEKAKGLIDTQAEFDNYINILDQAATQGRVTAEYAAAMRAEMLLLYPEFDTVAKAAYTYNDALSEGAQVQGVYTKSLEEISAAIKGITEDMDSAQGSVSTLQSIIDEYNETGIMSVDMLQQLMELEPEYIALLDVSSNGISMNQSATDALIESKLKLIETNLALKEAEYASAIAAEFSAYANDEAYDAAGKVAGSSGSAAAGLQGLIASAYSSGYSVETLAQKLYELGYVQNTTGSKAIAMANQILTASAAMYNLRAAAGSTIATLASFSGTATGTQKTSGGGGGGGEDPQIKILEARKKAIEDEAKARIDALKKMSDAEDRKRKRDDYLANRSEALADVRRAQSRSGADARADEYESEKKLAELDSDWQEQLQDWNMDDQIAAIEEWKDAMVEAIDAQIEALRSAGGGGGGGGGIGQVMADEASVLEQNKDVLINALLEMDNENLPEKIKKFYEMFDASQYTSDVDFSDKLAGIKTQWDAFKDQNGDDWAIHYSMVLDDGRTLSADEINEYINGLLGQATSESELLELDRRGLGILLRVNPEFNAEDDASQEVEKQWSDTVNALGTALDEILAKWEFNNLDMESAKKAVEDAFSTAFEAVVQNATDTGVVIEQQMAGAADTAGISMLNAVNTYAPLTTEAWRNNLINPMIEDLGDLSTTLDGVLAKLGNVASFGGLSGINGATGASSTTSNSQNNFITLRGAGRNQTDPLARWFL
jgi:predicted RNase H-like HicB family nuclease